MDPISNWFREGRERSEKEKEMRDKCSHDWLEVPAKVEATNYSLIGFITGLTRITVNTEGVICKKCGKSVFIEIE